MKSRASALYPFVPSGADFAAALSFFGEIGFETAWRSDGLAGLRFGDAYFMLQDIDVPEWQKNQMITFEVDDLGAYWSEIEEKDLGGKFAGVRLRPPTDFPLGSRDPHRRSGRCVLARKAGPPIVI